MTDNISGFEKIDTRKLLEDVCKDIQDALKRNDILGYEQANALMLGILKTYFPALFEFKTGKTIQ